MFIGKLDIIIIYCISQGVGSGSGSGQNPGSTGIGIKKTQINIDKCPQSYIPTNMVSVLPTQLGPLWELQAGCESEYKWFMVGSGSGFKI